MTEASGRAQATSGPPNESLWRLFRRFLRFGALAWGGPVAQIAMIREALVEDERWISSERFNRVLGVYQALPGPEAHELCVYFGMLSRGRPGAIVAGLGFMLPGLLLMLALSWCYVEFGLGSSLWRGAMIGCQGAVTALIVRAVLQIGRHALTTRALWTLGFAAVVAQAAGVNAVAVLAIAGVLHAVWDRAAHWVGRARSALAFAPAIPASGGGDGWIVPDFRAPARAVATFVHDSSANVMTVLVQPLVQSIAHQSSILLPSIPTLFGSGLRAGLLTFGGAYTAIPFLRADAVVTGRWMSDAQFVDGLALSSILPAPFIIFSTFVGYVGGGLVGALVLTAGVFLPAFGFTLIGHETLERVVERPGAHAFLDGITAAVVGVIAVTAWTVGRGVLTSPVAIGTFVLALVALLRYRAPTTVAWVMVAAAVLGIVGETL